MDSKLSFILGIKLFTKAELIAIYGKRVYSKKIEAMDKFNRNAWKIKMRNPTKHIYTVNAFPAKYDNMLAHKHVKYRLSIVHLRLIKLLSTIIELGALTSRNADCYYYKVLVETRGNSVLDTKSRLIKYHGINGFRLVNRVTKYLKRILTGISSHSVYSSLENKINGYDTEVKAHTHLLVSSKSKLTSSDIRSIKSKLFNRYGNSIQFHIERFLNYQTHHWLVLNSSSNAGEVAHQLMIYIKYISKQGNKLPIVKSLDEAKEDINNPNFTQLINAIYLSQTRMRIKSAEQFKRYIRSNNTHISEFRWFTGKLYQLVRNQLITAKFSFKRDGSVSTIRVATPVPPLSNVYHKECFNNAFRLGFTGTPAKSSKIKEAEIQFQLLNGEYVIYFNST